MYSHFLQRGDKAEVVCDGPTSFMTLLADSADNDQSLTANRITLHKGSPGAPAHFHNRARESYFMLDGSLEVLAGQEILTLGKGDFLGIPPRMPHAFAPPPGAQADFLLLFSPGVERFEYFRLLDKIYKGEADAKEIPATSERFDNHHYDSPIWRQRAAG